MIINKPLGSNQKVDALSNKVKYLTDEIMFHKLC